MDIKSSEKKDNFLIFTVDNGNQDHYYTPPKFLVIKNFSSLVQSVERRTVNPYVAGSSPAGGAKFLKPANKN